MKELRGTACKSFLLTTPEGQVACAEVAFVTVEAQHFFGPAGEMLSQPALEQFEIVATRRSLLQLIDQLTAHAATLAILEERAAAISKAAN